MPDLFRNIYQDFQELDAARSSNGYGPNPISYSEILAFYKLNKIQVEPWEVNILRYFDSLIMNLHNTSTAEKQKKTK